MPEEELSESEKVEACRKADARIRWAGQTPFIGNKKDEVAEAHETYDKLACETVL